MCCHTRRCVQDYHVDKSNGNRSWRLVYKVFHVLLEGTPEHIDVYRICSDMEGVTVIHEVHAWIITSGYDALTAHILIGPSYEGDVVWLLTRLREIATRDHSLRHVTIQLGWPASSCDGGHRIDHLEARAASEVA